MKYNILFVVGFLIVIIISVIGALKTRNNSGTIKNRNLEDLRYKIEGTYIMEQQ